MRGAVIQCRFNMLQPHGHRQAGRSTAAVQRQGSSDSFSVDPSVFRTMGPGQALPGDLRGHMEQVLGADFSDVRVHIGPQASSIGALAFTSGSDIYFAPGHYQPASAAGRDLIGHELAHVVQQRQGRVRNRSGDVRVVNDRALEAEADRLGRKAAQAPIQRKELSPQPQTVTRPALPSPTKSIQRASSDWSQAAWWTGAAVVSALAYQAYQSYQAYQNHVPVRQNRQPQNYGAEVGRYMAERQRTRGQAPELQAFREEFPGNAVAFRTRVRSGVRFLWVLRTDGVLGIASARQTQHTIAARGHDVIAAGQGQLRRVADTPALEQRLAALDFAQTARDNLAQANLPQNAGNAGIYRAEALRAAIHARRARAAGAAAVGAIHRGVQDDVVYLDLHSGHYQPELSGSILSSRAWAPAIAAWRAAGFAVQRWPGSAWV